MLAADAQGGARTPPWLAHRAQVPVNPASVMKLVTTYAALEQLGPAYTWSTPVFVGGTVQGGSLKGNVYIQGQGDPKLVVERLWLLMRRLQAQGIQVIVGDIVPDRSAFDVPWEQDPAVSMASPCAPGQTRIARCALLNYKSSVMTFVPDAPAGLAHIQYDPPLAGVQRPATVALAPPGQTAATGAGPCARNLNDPLKVVFQGLTCRLRRASLACGLPAPREFAARAVGRHVARAGEASSPAACVKARCLRGIKPRLSAPRPRWPRWCAM